MGLLDYVTIAASLVGTLSAIAVFTPNKVDDKWLQLLLDLINYLAMNFGNAKNK